MIPPLVVAKWCMRKQCRHSILLTHHYPDLGSAFDWLKICFIQSGALGQWYVISMEFLRCSSDFISYRNQWWFHENVNWHFSQAMLILDKKLQNVLSSKLFRIAELVERENEAYHKLDPDPFDDRHPGNIIIPLQSNDDMFSIVICIWHWAWQPDGPHC